MDLTNELAKLDITTDAAPDYKPTAGGMTLDDLRRMLDDNGRKYKIRDGKLDIVGGCLICGATEGNPSLWIVDGNPVYKCHREKKCGATWRDVIAKFNKSARLPRINALDLPARYPHPRQSVIHGLLRRGDVAGFVGPPKARKSWWLMQMALSVAAGIPFLNWRTEQGRVLIIDNELRGDDLSARMIRMTDAMGLTWSDVARHIDIVPLRGILTDLTAIRDELVREPDRYSLTIVDAFYKSLPRGLDENSNSDMTSALILLDEAAEKHNCGLAFAHHLSKGNQNHKSVTDLGSGAGAQSRSVDVHLAALPHEDENTVILQGVLRSQPPFAPVCLTYDYPLWRVSADKDPTAVAVVGKKSIPTMEAFLATIPTEPTPQKMVIDQARHTLCASGKVVLELLREASQAGLVEQQQPASRRLPYTIRRLPQKSEAA